MSKRLKGMAETEVGVTEAGGDPEIAVIGAIEGEPGDKEDFPQGN